MEQTLPGTQQISDIFKTVLLALQNSKTKWVVLPFKFKKNSKGINGRYLDSCWNLTCHGCLTSILVHLLTVACMPRSLSTIKNTVKETCNSSVGL